MAIGPEEADNITALESDALRKIEVEIDKFLREHYRPGEKLTTHLSAATDRLNDELVKRYQAAGWQVSYKSGHDQRDGYYCNFTFYSEKGRN